MKGLRLVDLKASRPGAVGRVHEANTQQLIIVIAGPVENNAGARQGGDVTLWVGCTLGQMCLFKKKLCSALHRLGKSYKKI